ncbi:MAG: hypothetical protein H2184_14575 [Candidatus Galacturonibacter soehngenii]|nr:hypothetical protein [Candidatus Galacturonibacter soehngenii]
MKELKKENIIKYIPLSPFIIFFILIIFQYLNVFIYFDDYGFASLSYSNSIEGVNGLNYNLSQLLKFLYLYYMDWGGRVISFGTEALLLKNGVIVMQIAMAITVTLILFFTYKIINIYNNKNKWFTSLFLCGLFGLIHIGMLRDSFYWYTSAVIYVMPFMPYLIGIYFYSNQIQTQVNENLKSNNSRLLLIKNILIAFILFIASFSQEQVSISLSFVVIALVVYQYISTKKIHLWDYVNLITTIVGTLLVVFAPGNRKRMEEKIEFYNTPIIQRTVANVDSILKEVFGYKFLYIMAVYILALLALGVLMMIKRQGNKIINAIFIIVNLILTIVYFIIKEPIYAYLENKVSKGVLMILLLCYITFIIFQITSYYIGCKKYILLIVFWASMCTISSMTFIPAITIRCYVPFVILSFGIITSLASDFVNEIKYGFVIGVIGLFILLPFSYKNYSIIYDGYKANYGYHIQNDNELKNASKKIKEGNQIKHVTLQKLNNTICSNIMQYEEGAEFIKVWMCEYYDLPQEIKFVWND